MIHYSIPTLHESTLIYPLPTDVSVHDIQTLTSECVSLQIVPTRANIRRVRRALDIVDNHRIRKIETAGTTRLSPRGVTVRIYEVNSQTRDLVHLVVANGDCRCSCEDARRRRPDFTGCKHSIAVQVYEERMLDLESYDECLDERHQY